MKPFSLVRVSPKSLDGVFEDVSGCLFRVSEACRRSGGSDSYEELGIKCGKIVLRSLECDPLIFSSASLTSDVVYLT